MCPSEDFLSPTRIADFLEEKLADSGSLKTTLTPQNIVKIKVSAENILPVCRTLKDGKPYYFLHLSTISAAVTVPENNLIELFYWLYSFNLAGRAVVSTTLEARGRFPSVSPLWPGARQYEAKISHRFNLEVTEKLSPLEAGKVSSSEPFEINLVKNKSK